MVITIDEGIEKVKEMLDEIGHVVRILYTNKHVVYKKGHPILIAKDYNFSVQLIFCEKCRELEEEVNNLITQYHFEKLEFK